MHDKAQREPARYKTRLQNSGGYLTKFHQIFNIYRGVIGGVNA